MKNNYIFPDQNHFMKRMAWSYHFAKIFMSDLIKVQGFHIWSCLQSVVLALVMQLLETSTGRV